MKRFLTSLVALVISISFTACSNSENPADLFNLDAPVELNGTSTTSADDNPEQQPIENLDNIPDNYKLLEGDIFAVVENGQIIKYKKGTQKGDGWTFVDCDKNGVTESITTTTTTTITTTSSMTVSHQLSTTSSHKQTTTTKSESVATKPPSTTTTKKPATQNTTSTKNTTTPKKTTTTTITTTTTKATTTTPKPTTTTTTTASVPFSYSIVQGLSGLPENVANYFQSEIDDADVATPVLKSKKTGGKTYALVYVLNGPPVTIRAVTKTGSITYKYPTSTSKQTSCYVIIMEGEYTPQFNKVS